MPLLGPQRGWMLAAMIALTLAVGVAVVIALSRLSPGPRRILVRVTTFIAGLFYVLEFFLPRQTSLFGLRPAGMGPTDNFLSPFIKPIGDAALVVVGLTVGLGVFNLVYVHGGNIARRRAGWYNSALFFAAFVAMVVVRFLNTLSQHAAPGWTVPAWVGQAHTVLFEGMLVSMNATMFSLLAFYLVSAAYRAFRVRSGEAALMMVAAVIVMLGQVPLGVWMTSFLPVDGAWAGLRMENVADWLLSRVNMPAQRGIDFGLGVGLLAMSLRVWLGLERGTFFEQET
jgi:hypothetical protein